MSERWIGVLLTLGAIGGGAVLVGLVMLVLAIWPEVQWWALKRLPLDDAYARRSSMAVVGAARRGWYIWMPHGIRIMVTLGGSRSDATALREHLAEVPDVRGKTDHASP